MWPWRRRRKTGTVILGEELARAHRNEAAHRATTSATPSPLEGARYEDGHANLVQLREAGADSIIASVARSFAAAGVAERSAITASLTTSDFYAVTMFARRSAARGLANSDSSELIDGLSALAMIERDRIDPRDIAWAASFLRLVGAHMTPADTIDAIFGNAAKIAEPATAEILRAFIGRSEAIVSSGWNMMVVDVAGRPLILAFGRERFEPTIDLLGVAFEVQAQLETDGYITMDPAIGELIVPIWLRGTPGAQNRLDRAVASVVVAGVHRPETNRFDYVFLACVYELPTAADAEELERLWPGGNRDFASLAVSAGRLALLIISSSAVVGQPNVESDATLRRFVEPMRRALASASGAG